ncbi:nitrite reductase (NAD(P)H) small subunit [Paenibacillus sp. J5C_2022]|uniref:Rieske (2Fe-2S) protein n=1 Tax=Paenibacillus sp. J5C2022 TaxID=2977129 RepID=UPI0021D2E777|nr:nitrite reductase (NAD(P)H) small subunit [Paenibacillus sp. J5C2022]MCU6707466.1 nitrite reductase (NAD(P)H) small subunit [Paenibacillus sp. J5C2022]
MTDIVNRYEVAEVEAIRRAGFVIYSVEGNEIGVFAIGESFYAWRNRCPHAAAPVCEGAVCESDRRLPLAGTNLPASECEGRRITIKCPWHGWEFDLRTGRHVATEKVKLQGYKVEVENDRVYVFM